MTRRLSFILGKCAGNTEVYQQLRILNILPFLYLRCLIVTNDNLV